MIKVESKLPKQDQIVVAYVDDGRYYFAKYAKVLTWRGYKVKFLNLQRSGTWRNDVIGWLPTPEGSENYKSKLVRKACVKAYNMDYHDFWNFYEDESEDYRKEKWQLMQKDFAKWFCQLDSVTAERFVEDL